MPPLVHTPDQITDRPLVALRVMLVPTAKLAEPVVPTGTFSPAGVERTLSPARPVAVRVSNAVAGAGAPTPQTFATPPPPQVCGAVQTPQVSVSPQPLEIVPQFLPWAAQATSRGRYWSCVVPSRATAPGPGRSAAESTTVLKVGGTQKILTRVCGVGGPPVVRGPAGEPVSTMVRATSVAVKAPDVRCPQLVKPVAVAQSLFPLAGLHNTGRQLCPAVQFPLPVQLAPVGEPSHLRAKLLSVLFLQKPQKTFT